MSYESFLPAPNNSPRFTDIPGNALEQLQGGATDLYTMPRDDFKSYWADLGDSDPRTTSSLVKEWVVTEAEIFSRSREALTNGTEENRKFRKFLRSSREDAEQEFVERYGSAITTVDNLVFFSPGNELHRDGVTRGYSIGGKTKTISEADKVLWHAGLVVEKDKKIHRVYNNIGRRREELLKQLFVSANGFRGGVVRICSEIPKESTERNGTDISQILRSIRSYTSVE